MKNRLLIFPVTVVVLLSLGVSAYAHHGFVAWFDMTHTITVKGTVTSLEWTNPHAYIYLDVKDEKSNIEKWSAEMTGIGMLARVGWSRNTVKRGDVITLIGKRAKDGKPMMLVDKVVLTSGQELPASQGGAAEAAKE